MSTATILAQVSRLGVELRVVEDRLQARPADRLPNDLRADLRNHKSELIRELRRDAAATEAWSRLQDVYLRAGSPAGWINRDVRMAENVVNEWWVVARTKAVNDRNFHEALRRWERLAGDAIVAAAEVGDGRRN